MHEPLTDAERGILHALADELHTLDQHLTAAVAGVGSGAAPQESVRALLARTPSLARHSGKVDAYVDVCSRLGARMAKLADDLIEVGQTAPGGYRGYARVEFGPRP